MNCYGKINVKRDDTMLCYNCFRERPDSGENPQGKGPCPYCGFDLEENAAKYPVALRAGTILNGRYIVGRVLGQGGFGITYLAWDQKLAARVAVKEYMPGELATRIGTTVSVMTAARNDDFTYGAERFNEEARTLAKFMGQPGIAGVTDFFDENDTSYFVMDYIEGISFKSYIANAGGKISVEEALDVMIPVLRALTAVHAEGFIHRDVTPDNIYITKDGNVKLLDFGSARYSLGDKSKSLDVILKVGYAPKEQYIRRGRQGPYTDVYSCAACLYAAITGYLPPESLERLDHDELVPPSQAGAEIPAYLERAILKGLAVQPEDRFQTAAEFLDAIENQRMVELPGEGGRPASGHPDGSQPNAADSDRPGADGGHGGQAAGSRKGTKRRLPLIIGGIAAAAVVFAVGSLVGGGLGTGGTGAGESGGANPVAEALAPKVTIAGQEYSTATTELDLTGRNLTDADLISIGQMKDLKKLIMENNSAISDISPLAELTELEELVLPCPSGITDLTPIAGLTSLTRLSIVGEWSNTPPATSIQDFGPISGLTGLTRLDLVLNNAFDLSILSGLTELRVLRLMGSVTAESLSPLSGLTKLTELRVDGNGLTDISGIAGMTEMCDLQITGNFYADDLSALSGMTKLETLRFDANGLKSLAGIENLIALREADFYGDDATYTDVDPLKNLTNLEILRLPMHSQSIPYSIEGLAGLTKLTDLDIDCGARSFEPLRNLTNLRNLSASNGGMVDGAADSLEPLSGLTNLQSLAVRVRPVGDRVDLSPLANLTNLRTLYVATDQNDHVTASDLSPLSGLTNLASLELHIRNLTDLSALAPLSNLQTLTISDPDSITDWSPVDHVAVVNRGY